MGQVFPGRDFGGVGDEGGAAERPRVVHLQNVVAAQPVGAVAGLEGPPAVGVIADLGDLDEGDTDLLTLVENLG